MSFDLKSKDWCWRFGTVFSSARCGHHTYAGYTHCKEVDWPAVGCLTGRHHVCIHHCELCHMLAASQNLVLAYRML